VTRYKLVKYGLELYLNITPKYETCSITSYSAIHWQLLQLTPTTLTHQTLVL